MRIKQYLQIFTAPEWFVLFIGVVLRFAFLALKPPHFDEGINGWFVDQVWSKGYYSYDPTNYHGPLHFYLLQLSTLVFGRNIVSLRLVTSLFSTGALILILRMKKFYGRAALWAAILIALSPGMTFYSRYAIHEAELLFALVAFFYGWLSYALKKSVYSALWICFSIAIMLTTKEVHFIFLGTFTLAIFLTHIFAKYKQTAKNELHLIYFKIHKQDWIQFWQWPFVISCVFVILMYTGFGQDFHGLQKFFAALAPWLKTGTQGNGHDKAFMYWLTLLVKYEWPFLIAFVICVASLLKGKSEFRFWSFYSLGILLAFSIIPYKTPWCIITIMWSFAIPLAMAFEYVLRKFETTNHSNTKRIGLFFVASIPLVHSGYQTYRVNFVDYANVAEPYVYVSTSSDYYPVFQPIHELVKKKPEMLNMKIVIQLNSSWPLPWEFGTYTNLQWAIPANRDLSGVDVVVVDATKKMIVESMLTEPYYSREFLLRGAQEASLIYYRESVFTNLDTAKLKLVEAAKHEKEDAVGFYTRVYFNNVCMGQVEIKTYNKMLTDSWSGESRKYPAPVCILYDAEFKVTKKTKYQFSTESDDGSQLFVDDKLVVDNSGTHAAQLRLGSIELAPGIHKIHVEYHDEGGGALIRVMYQAGENGQMQLASAPEFSPLVVEGK